MLFVMMWKINSSSSSSSRSFTNVNDDDDDDDDDGSDGGVGGGGIGADLPGAVGANVLVGKGSVGACTQRKNVKNTIRKKCIGCGQLILRKISKTGATRCQILRLKCTKFDFRWGSAPDPLWELTALPRPLAVFKGAYLPQTRWGSLQRSPDP